MAAFISVLAGNFNDGATWGNTSPGVAGVDFPGADGDTATIGHAVSYDAGDSTINFGSLTINSGGVLEFPTTANSTINFDATAILTINSGGILRAGTSAGPIDSSFHCRFYWAQGASIRNVLVLNDGGTIDIYGDSNFYGATKNANLDSDWTTGQTLYVSGDYTALWSAGQKFWIHKNATAYGDYTTDAAVFTIATIGAYDAAGDRTPITISEAAPAVLFTALNATTGRQSKLLMLSRNVELADPAATWGVNDHAAYSEMIVFDNNQGEINSLININETVTYGWDKAVDGGYNYKNSGGVFVSNNYGLYRGTNHQATCDFVSNNYGLYSGTNHQATGDFVSNNYGLGYGTSHQATGDFVSNNAGVNGGTNHQATCDFVSNNYGLYSGTNHQATGDFVSNNYGLRYGTSHQATGDFVSNTIDVLVSSATILNKIILEDCTISGASRRALRIYGNSGTFLNLVSGDTNFQTPPSSNLWVFEAIPNSYCDSSFVNSMYLAYHQTPMSSHVYAAGTYSLTFKIYPIGWTTALTQDDIVLSLDYPDTAIGITRSNVVNTVATYANAGWRDVTVTFTTLQSGVVYFNLMLKRYEALASVLIDPVWSIS